MSPEELQKILNAVYQGAVAECEQTEVQIAKHVRINGHHMAQRITENVRKEMERRGLVRKLEAA